MLRLRPLVILAFVLISTLPCSAADQAFVLVARGNQVGPIIVAPSAGERTRSVAKTLAMQLQRITDQEFDVREGDGSSGIVVGTARQFPQLAQQLPLDPKDDEREWYLLRSHQRGLELIGTTELAIEHAVWDLLYRLGYRQFFPGSTWEVVPRTRELSISVNTVERPSYLSRSIWYGYGPWDYAKGPYEDWCRKNRVTKGIDLNTGHAYEGIHAKYKDVFLAHPEYLALVGGKRSGNKFCISNPGLRKLVVDDALAHFQKHPQDDSLSVEPSDGLGWCECTECLALGSPSDRAVLLANEVATEVSAKYPGKRFGMYAYGGHVAPPKREVHPRVVVSVATAFGSAGLTLDELMSGWQARGATLGIREYFGVHPWDRDLPGKARGANLEYLTRTIPHFHTHGARFFSAESSDNWGPNGLGYYLAARMLWNVREATPDRVDSLRADFLNRAFGPAAQPMDRFYRLIDGSGSPLLSDDLIGRMYRLLKESAEILQQSGASVAERSAVRTRLEALILYTHYVERWFEYSNAKGDLRQAAFERLIRFAYRMRGTMMIHTLALYRDVIKRDKQIRIPPEAQHQVPEGRNPWKSSTPFSSTEIDELLQNGMERHKLLDFQAVAFSDDLVPAAPLKLPDVKPGSYGLFFRNEFDLHTWQESAPSQFPFSVRAGLIYGRLGNARISLLPDNELQGKSVDEVSVAPDKQKREVSLRSPISGLHRLHLSDGGDGTEITWPQNTPLVIRSDPADPVQLHGRWTLYFYVPVKTQVIGGFADGPGELRDPAGKTVHQFGNEPGYFRIPVPAGLDGTLWQFHHGNGRRLLMTVPPYLARNAQELLLPREVVERDRKRD